MSVLDKWIELYYGQSGVGKSESIVAVIMRIFRDTGKKARVLVGDGSGATYTALVQAGIVEMLDYTIRDWPLTTLSQLCQGFFPEDPLDPKSKMVAMTKEKYASLGVVAIEGLSVGAAYVMGDKKGGFAEQAGRGIKIGQDSPIKLQDVMFNAAGEPIKDSGPGTVFGGNPLSHFQHAQKRMLGFIEQSKSLPGWVIWTGHERAAEDKISGQKLIGAEVAGGALTPMISRQFNNTLHFGTVEKSVKVTDEHTNKISDVIDAEYRIYTRDHFRSEGGMFVKYKAVSRTPFPGGWPTGELDAKKQPVMTGAMPLYFESSTPGVSILEFYENIKNAREHQTEGVKVG